MDALSLLDLYTTQTNHTKTSGLHISGHTYTQPTGCHYQTHQRRLTMDSKKLSKDNFSEGAYHHVDHEGTDVDYEDAANRVKNTPFDDKTLEQLIEEPVEVKALFIANDHREMKIYAHAEAMLAALYEMDMALRNVVKYGDLEEDIEYAEVWRTQLGIILTDHGIDLYW